MVFWYFGTAFLGESHHAGSEDLRSTEKILTPCGRCSARRFHLARTLDLLGTRSVRRASDSVQTGLPETGRERVFPTSFRRKGVDPLVPELGDRVRGQSRSTHGSRFPRFPELECE